MEEPLVVRVLEGQQSIRQAPALLLVEGGEVDHQVLAYELPEAELERSSGREIHIS